MAKTIDMQFIQYMSFFERVMGLRTVHCFSYNRNIIFVVQPNFMARAIGEHGNNTKNLSLKLKKRVKIIAEPSGLKDIQKFVSAIVYPVKLNKIIIENDEAVISASPQERAALIGRDKVRLEELRNILEEYFSIKKLRIV